MPATGSKRVGDNSHPHGAFCSASRPPRWRGKRNFSYKKSVNVSNSSEQFPSNYASAARSQRRKPKQGLVTGPPYVSWSNYLASNFELPLYNEFRRLAIDDLLSRHVDYGFNALMSFYKTCLFGSSSIPSEVLTDLATLSRSPPFDHHQVVHDLFYSALKSRKMGELNRDRAGLVYNRERQTNPV